MSEKHFLVDTNVLLRFLSGQPPAQAAAAKKLFSEAAAGDIVLDLSPVIVAEVYYTLTSFYGVERKAAAQNLALLLQQHGIKLQGASQVLSALNRLQSVNVGFADAYLVAGASENKIPIASFDRDFDKFKEIARYEPVS